MRHMKKKRIIHNHSISKNLKEIEGLRALKMLLPLAKPILVSLGVDYKGLKDSFSKIDGIHEQMKKLATLPDRFNDIFSDLGWIMYDMMNVEVAESAIQMAGMGNIESAEAIIVDHYSGEQVEWQLNTMLGVKAFYERMTLAKLALIDYKEERYHACVPVVLALLDGLVNHVGKQNRGFFAEGADLSAWDSIAAHDTGLNKIVELFKKSRKKTNSNSITIPYRNGIIHGMDLGYANKTVAAKCWAALFATREWAIKYENDQIGKPPPTEDISWSKLFEQLRQNETNKRALEAWKPRENLNCSTLPDNPPPENLPQDSPERTLAQYFSFWRQKNYGYMSKLIHKWGSISDCISPAQVRQEYYNKTLTKYQFTSITDNAASITTIGSSIEFTTNSQIFSIDFEFRLICIDQNGEITTRGEAKTSWKIISWCVY
jgi:hypothetical protein